MRRPLFPIGKTQWSKWQDPARSMYNEEIAAGSSFAAAVAAANEVQANTRGAKRGGLLAVLEETLEGLQKVGEVVETVSSVAATVAPVVAVAVTAAKRPRAKKGK